MKPRKDIRACIQCGQFHDLLVREPAEMPGIPGKAKWEYNLSDHCTSCWLDIVDTFGGSTEQYRKEIRRAFRTDQRRTGTRSAIVDVSTD